MTAMASAGHTQGTRPRTAALIAGTGLLVMTFVAGIANVVVIANPAVPGDPQATAMKLSESADLVRLASAGFIIAAILDITVAWGSYIVLRSVNPGLSLLGGWPLVRRRKLPDVAG
jgi:hypothetical protein